MTCFRCGGADHWADSPACPWLTKAADRADHEKRIDSLKERYWEFAITEWQKREYIRHENRLWYGGKTPAHLT